MVLRSKRFHLGDADVVARFDLAIRSVLPMLGRTYRHSAAKAQRLLDWLARPAADTVVDSAESLIRLNAI